MSLGKDIVSMIIDCREGNGVKVKGVSHLSAVDSKDFHYGSCVLGFGRINKSPSRNQALLDRSRFSNNVLNSRNRSFEPQTD